jgi:sialate O-acetylesterase
MKKATLITLIATFSLLILQSVHAEVKLPAIISSNMVLQRNTNVTLWGWAAEGEKVTIQASWLEEKLETEADKDGNWYVKLKTTNSKAPQSIQIKSVSSEITLDNVLFGEVWLCSGQSNMEQSLGGYKDQPTYEALMTVAKSKNPNLRLFTVERFGSKTPLNDVEKFRSWAEAAPENVVKFSAVAYFFGQQLQEILDKGFIHPSVSPW